MGIKFTDKYGLQEVRALSWKQPFASLMLHGKVETRVWPSTYFGWVLICASQTAYSFKKTLDIAGSEQFDRIFKTINESGERPLPLGQAIAIGYLDDTYPLDSFHFYGNGDYEKKVESACFIKYNEFLHGHFYRDVQAIEPFAWSGQQGWKKLDQETIDKIVLL